MYIKIYGKALLCLYFGIFLSVHAVKAQTLKVGERIPPELWDLPLQMVNHPEGEETLTLGRYRDKLIILDFWATWCSPCVKSIIKLDTLRKEFEEHLEVIPVTYEAPENVAPFLLKRRLSLLSVVNNRELKEYFPHQVIPHQVWIRRGKVLAITGSAYSSAENIRRLLDDQQVKMMMKEEDRNFDPESLLILEPGTRYASGLKGQVNKGEKSEFSIKLNGIVMTNATAEMLFRRAFIQEYPFIQARNRIIYEVPDSTLYKLRSPVVSELRTFEEDSLHREWLRKYTCTYYNSYAEPRSRRELLRKMQEDIASYFQTAYGVEVRIEKRKIPCYVLRKTGDIPPVSEAIPGKEYRYILQDKSLKIFADGLAAITDNQPFPVTDETGYTGNVTLRLTSAPDDIFSLQKELPLYGLELTREIRETEMLVFKQTTPEL